MFLVLVLYACTKDDFNIYLYSLLGVPSVYIDLPFNQVILPYRSLCIRVENILEALIMRQNLKVNVEASSPKCTSVKAPKKKANFTCSQVLKSKYFESIKSN